MQKETRAPARCGGDKGVGRGLRVGLRGGVAPPERVGGEARARLEGRGGEAASGGHGSVCPLPPPR